MQKFANKFVPSSKFFAVLLIAFILLIMMAVVKSFKNGEVTRQVMKGKTVTRYKSNRFVDSNADGGSRLPEVDITRVSAKIDGRQKTATRTISRWDDPKDVLEIKTTENYPVGDKRVNTQKMEPELGDTLNTYKGQQDSIYKGDKFIGKRTITQFDLGDKEKCFFDKDGNLIKTVIYDRYTGLRKLMHTMDGSKYLLYDEKGLPVWTDGLSRG